MKISSGILVASLFLASCNKVTVASLQSEDHPIERGKKVVFENDTVRLTYNFWSKDGGGLMSFSVYNKLDEPIYIDWKNSGFIPNDRLLTYWQDETNTEGIATTSGYSYKGLAVGSGRIQTKAIRQERIGAIPPHSMISK